MTSIKRSSDVKRLKDGQGDREEQKFITEDDLPEWFKGDNPELIRRFLNLGITNKEMEPGTVRARIVIKDPV